MHSHLLTEVLLLTEAPCWNRKIIQRNVKFLNLPSWGRTKSLLWYRTVSLRNSFHSSNMPKILLRRGGMRCSNLHLTVVSDFVCILCVNCQVTCSSKGFVKMQSTFYSTLEPTQIRIVRVRHFFQTLIEGTVQTTGFSKSLDLRAIQIGAIFTRAQIHQRLTAI